MTYKRLPIIHKKRKGITSSTLNSLKSFTLRQAQGKPSSFTLVELLVVIGILAILTAAVVIILNPAELLRQSRDSTRMTDLASIDKALSLLTTQVPEINLGVASTVYISIADNASATCGSLGLPSLPAGYVYKCVNSTNLRNTNGTGWIPVNFASSSVGSFSSLPIDPTNTTSSGLYYTYVMGGSWKLNTLLESNKYVIKSAEDGGIDPASYEKGSNLTLAPFVKGLVGYWSFDEGSGTITYDKSGNNNNGTLTNGPAWQTSSNCKRGGCLLFDGSNDRVVASRISRTQSSIGIGMWVKKVGATNSYAPLVEQGATATGIERFRLILRGQTMICFGNDDVTNNFYCTPSGVIQNGNWYHIVAGFNGSYYIYINGVSQTLTQVPGIYGSTGSQALYIGDRDYDTSVDAFNGQIDDVYIYNRALSASEIQAIYNATK